MRGDGGLRVGELGEEMVFESRVGEVFLLGVSNWRIEQIARDRAIVMPAPGEPGKLPFGCGDGPGRAAELGRAVGQMTCELDAVSTQQALARLTSNAQASTYAESNCLSISLNSVP